MKKTIHLVLRYSTVCENVVIPIIRSRSNETDSAGIIISTASQMLGSGVETCVLNDVNYAQPFGHVLTNGGNRLQI